MTGPQSLDFTALAALASELRDDPVRRVTTTDEAFRAKVAARGVSARALDTVLGFFIASRNGEFATVRPQLEQLLGRGPITMRQVLIDRGTV